MKNIIFMFPTNDCFKRKPFSWRTTTSKFFLFFFSFSKPSLKRENQKRKKGEKRHLLIMLPKGLLSYLHINKTPSHSFGSNISSNHHQPLEGGTDLTPPCFWFSTPCNMETKCGERGKYSNFFIIFKWKPCVHLNVKITITITKRKIGNMWLIWDPTTSSIIESSAWFPYEETVSHSWS